MSQSEVEDPTAAIEYERPTFALVPHGRYAVRVIIELMIRRRHPMPHPKHSSRFFLLSVTNLNARC
jgi:hypothetical protein